MGIKYQTTICNRSAFYIDIAIIKQTNIAIEIMLKHLVAEGEVITRMRLVITSLSVTNC